MAKAGDPRIGSLLDGSSTSPKKHRVAIIGYPCDEGVARNKGRVGARNGPAVMRARLPTTGTLVNPEWDFDISCIDLQDKGDVELGSTLEDTHVNLESSVKKLLDEGYITIVVGGGNDQSYPNAKALMGSLASGSVGVVNIDAHFDARPLIDGKAHSGSPFRQLLMDDQFSGNGKFFEFASQGHQCSKDHADFIKENGGEIIWLSEVQQSTCSVSFSNVLNSFGSLPVFISFDIDGIRGSDCPGVSCPGVVGITSEDALRICFESGKHQNTRLLDISEFNPDVESDRTARLVTAMIYFFLGGISKR